MSKLTKRQTEILTLIENHMAATGAPPTRAEIAKIMGFSSPNAAEDHLKALARKGIIKLVPGTSRGIRLVNVSNNLVHLHNNLPKTVRNTNSDHHSTSEVAQPNFAGIPIIGSVAAGNPILATEHIEDFYAIGKHAFKPAVDYLLRVRGDSMLHAGILDGDLLAVHSTTNIQQGQIVVARINDEVTVKRFYQDGFNVRLKAENPNFAPIDIDLRGQKLNIEGIAVGVVRNFN